MTGYYFENNETSAIEAFQEAGIALKGAFLEYVDDLVEYLAYEYNCPFMYFNELIGCDGIHENFEDGVTYKEFADIILAEEELVRQQSYVALLETKMHRVV